MPSRVELVQPSWLRAGRNFATAEAGVAWAVVLASITILAINTGLVLRGVAPVLDGYLLDTDDYMRLVRVEQLWHSGAWFDSVIHRVDPPNGLALHWSRPMDILLTLGAVPGAPLVGFRTALFWWGVLISPLLNILSLVAIAWAAIPLVPRRWLPLAVFFLALQPGDLARFMVGRPDHHGLLILLLILVLGFGLRIVKDPENRNHAKAAGFLCALAIWVSVEFLVPTLATIAALGLCWVLNDRRFARMLVAYSVGLCVGIAAALLTERGIAAVLVFEVDKISLPHLILFAANGLLWWTLASADERGWLGVRPLLRATWAAIGALMVVALLFVAFPQIFENPMETGGGLYISKHLANVKETQPLITWSAMYGEQAAIAWGKAILWLGVALLAVPWMIYQCYRDHGPGRRMWILLGMMSLALVPLTVYQLRWASYSETVLVLPYTCLAIFLVTRLEAVAPTAIVRVIRPLLLVGMCIWVFIPGTFATPSDKAENPVASLRETCAIRALTDVLNDPSGLGSRPRKLLALIDFGPEILYRTSHSVLSIPNHRYQPGFTASYHIMSAEDFGAARQILNDQAVDLVMICPKSADRWFYTAENGGRTLYQALSEDDPPSFLVPVPLPDSVGAIKLFAVRPDA